MPRYSVAEAKNTLPRLIDRALAGEEVVITRHGKPVVEINAKKAFDRATWIVNVNEMARARDKLPMMPKTGLQILREMYDETPW